MPTRRELERAKQDARNMNAGEVAGKEGSRRREKITAHEGVADGIVPTSTPAIVTEDHDFRFPEFKTVFSNKSGKLVSDICLGGIFDCVSLTDKGHPDETLRQIGKNLAESVMANMPKYGSVPDDATEEDLKTVMEELMPLFDEIFVSLKGRNQGL